MVGLVRACSSVEECASCALHLWHVQRFADRMMGLDNWDRVGFLAQGLQEHWEEAKRICFDFDSLCPGTGEAVGDVMRAVRRRDVFDVDTAVRTLGHEMSYCLAVQSQSVGDIRREVLGSEFFV